MEGLTTNPHPLTRPARQKRRIVPAWRPGSAAHDGAPAAGSKGRGLAALALYCAAMSALAGGGAPELALAGKYAGGLDLADYWVSEKLDGVRAYWDGKKLISRGGNAFAAPAWFVAAFPAAPLDGELWLGRGRFEETASVVTRSAPHEGWRQLRYMVFDLPASALPFDERLRELRALAAAADSPYLAVVAQEKIADHAALARRLDAVVAAGGEGLMLRRGSALYRGGRSGDLLKFKKFDDAEARVVAHNPGKGKFRGMMGSVTVEMENGTRFRIGSGFTNAQRRNPPPIGGTVTFRHQGLTAKGVPRFPVFWRLRTDEPGP